MWNTAVYRFGTVACYVGFTINIRIIGKEYKCGKCDLYVYVCIYARVKNTENSACTSP
jgi:hypothetical protein